MKPTLSLSAVDRNGMDRKVTMRNPSGYVFYNFALHMRCGLQIIGTSSGPSRGSEDDGQQSPAEEEDQTLEKSAKGRCKSSSTMTEECIEEVTTTESSERDGIKSSGTIDSSKDTK